MKELEKKDHSIVSPIFSCVTNSKPVIFSVIDGNVDGQIYVDSFDNPKTALIALYDMFFLSGQRSTPFCIDIYDLLTNVLFPSMLEDYFDFYCMANELREDIERLFASRIMGRPVRKTFEYTNEAFEQRVKWKEMLPKDYCMEMIDNDFITRHAYDKEFWNPRSKRFGLALTFGNEVVCECIACFVGGGQAEISIDTNEKYRNKGFATLTCTAFIEYCHSIGLTPNWGCWDFRTASIALAKRLGFVEQSNDIVFGITK